MYLEIDPRFFEVVVNVDICNAHLPLPPDYFLNLPTISDHRQVAARVQAVPRLLQPSFSIRADPF